ncbi:MAG: aldose 1-epimerase [Flavobacteriaceae bacterium]|nr:aldose 1-epimerase [Flavobacteriaceae bacterium]
MFKIKTSQSKNTDEIILSLEDKETNSFATLNLNNGGSLESLTIKGNSIIKNLIPLKYKDTFASSILFPFAGRIKNGRYIFLDKLYSLPINEIENQNALHGLIYNKPFHVISQCSSNKKVEVVLEYRQKDLVEGFPYSYSVQLKYILTSNDLTLTCSINNTGNQSFPFSVGWHPYFHSDNLNVSRIKMNCLKKIIFDKNLVAIDEKPLTYKGELLINKKFDDCFLIKGNVLKLITPGYQLKLRSSNKYNYLIVYTINEANVIALEPLTGAPNCFNNLKGLQVLKPKDNYSITWEILVEKN